ncbi:hypothetical protein SASPL_134720 [Salvia splendens]|uniref:Phosphoacetylglucosamine mutase n=1 Tax=Salvia splendens TaxID=180675 RepID=A0A8X8ZFY7_SALSN|nr:hypothetical protein SASPL_134720 [Salvia splendens]
MSHPRCLLDYIPQRDSTQNVSDKLVVDGADGVGGEKLDNLKTRLGYLTVGVRNCGGGVLTEGVGADYVQKEKMAPRNFGPADAGMNGTGSCYDSNRSQVPAKYDIGIYFKANGHGTVLFSDAFLSWLEMKNQELTSTSQDSDQHKAALRLLAVSRLINQAVGDALSGLFLVEAILKHMGWSIHKWNELYQDLPSRQLKVKVVDRTAVITEKAETKVVSPAGIQEAIDAETDKYPKGRCFIHPSGTEDVVRVYAEASSQEGADHLANSVVSLVEQYLGFDRRLINPHYC